MVAYTSELCLPYLEGSDSLCLNTGTVCEPSNAWCDLINLVNTQLDAIDDIAARTGRAIPLARISYVPDTPVSLPNDSIPFDTVDVDTDSMVDLDSFVGIIPRRNGVYEAHLYIEYDNPIGPVSAIVNYAQICIGNELIPNIFGTNEIGVAWATNETAIGIDGVKSRSARTLWEFTDVTPVPRTIYARVDSGSTTLVTKAFLTVLWHSEVVP